MKITAAIFFLPIIVFLMTAPGCSAPEPERNAGEPEKVKAVATIFPLADLVENIGGEAVEVTLLLRPGDSPHTFEPTVEQARVVAGADLLFYIGEGLDDWAVSLAREEEITTVNISASLEEQLLSYSPVRLEEKRDVGQEHDHSSRDPHIWTDPVLVSEAVAPLIAAKLAEAAPQYRDLFYEKLALYQNELDNLHREISSLVESFSRKRFISYHSAWQYFARRYGLEEAAAVEDFPGKEPSAQWLVSLVHLAEEQQINIIFAEPQLSPKAAALIAAEIGGKVHYLDPLGGNEIPGRDSYLDLMRFNASVFREALQ